MGSATDETQAAVAEEWGCAALWEAAQAAASSPFTQLLAPLTELERREHVQDGSACASCAS